MHSLKINLMILLAGLLTGTVSAQNSMMTNEIDSVSYSLGTIFGSNMKNAGMKAFNDQLLMQGILDASSGAAKVLTDEQANACLNQYMMKLQEQQAMSAMAEGQQFLSENAKKEGVVTLPSGLQYKVIKEGTGISPSDTSTVTVHYTGTFIDGKVFDSSVERGEPATFPLNRVIAGWTEALQLMKAGSKWTLYLPPNLAYGQNGPPGIGANKVLIFDVELISFR
jgi:FKBP-type peptidyl-prolyl cis-trans isomerase FklB